MPDDVVEMVAQMLHRAYVTDTKRADEVWPPSPAQHRAWRRAAAAAIDLGARSAVEVQASGVRVLGEKSAPR